MFSCEVFDNDIGSLFLELRELCEDERLLRIGCESMCSCEFSDSPPRLQ
jgi:hypothetical protein